MGDVDTSDGAVAKRGPRWKNEIGCGSRNQLPRVDCSLLQRKRSQRPRNRWLAKLANSEPREKPK